MFFFELQIRGAETNTFEIAHDRVNRKGVNPIDDFSYPVRGGPFLSAKLPTRSLQAML